MHAYLNILYIYEVVPTINCPPGYSNIRYVTLGDTSTEFNDQAYVTKKQYNTDRIIYISLREDDKGIVTADRDTPSMKQILKTYFKYTGKAYTIDEFNKLVELRPNDKIYHMIK